MPAHLRAAGSLDGFWAVLDEWTTHLAAREMKPETIEQREAYLLRFFRRTRTSPEMVTDVIIEAFIATVTPRSSKREAYVSALRSFYRFAVARGYTETNPAADLHARQPKYPPPDYFSSDEVDRIVQAATTRQPPKRQWAIILLFETGARIGSLAGVQPGDVHESSLFFRRAKNDRAYSVLLTPRARQACDELLTLHRGTDTLIGRHEDTIGDWFRDAARDSGLPEGRVNAHLARHTAATLLYERTKDPLLVKDFLNHQDLKQIARYARVKDDTMRLAMSESLTG